MEKRRKKFLILAAVAILLVALLVTGLVLTYRSLANRMKNNGLTTALSLQSEEFPVIDGTYFMQAYGEAVRAILTGQSISIAREHVLFTGPDQAAENLLSGKADLVLLSEAAAEAAVERGKEQGIELLSVPVAYDGRIIFADGLDEDASLTAEEFDALYNSGDLQYHYSTFCYWQSVWRKGTTQPFAINGIVPTEQSIASGVYPRTYGICAVIRQSDTITPAKTVLSWMLGEEGQETLKTLGYINRAGETIAEGSGANAYYAYATRNETSEEGAGIRSIKGSDGKPTLTGMSTNYLVENPLVWTTYKENANVLLGEITGLANQTVQNTVNKRIRSAAEKMARVELPTYRGVREIVPEGSLLLSTEVSASLLFNYNNVLSVGLDAVYTYAVADETGVIAENAWGYYANTVELSSSNYLNFDLNTGREISLANVFVDGADYLDTLTYALASNAIFLDNVILTGSYKEMREAQKFYLCNDALYIVIDEDAPDYILKNYKRVFVPVHFSEIAGSLAITSRYYDAEASIYELDAPPMRSLIPMYQVYDVVNTAAQTYGEVETNRTWSYSSYLSSYGKNMVQAQSQLNSTALSALRKAGVKATYDVTTLGSRQNQYLNVTAAGKLWQEGAEIQTTYTYHCYDLDALKEVKLADLFWAGFHYEEVIREALEEEVRLQGGLYKNVTTRVNGKNVTERKPLSEEETRAAIQKLASTDNGFVLNTDSVSVSFTASLQEGDGCIALRIPFSDFGCDNMTIFSEN